MDAGECSASNPKLVRFGAAPRQAQRPHRDLHSVGGRPVATDLTAMYNLVLVWTSNLRTTLNCRTTPLPLVFLPRNTEQLSSRKHARSKILYFVSSQLWRKSRTTGVKGQIDLQRLNGYQTIVAILISNRSKQQCSSHVSNMLSTAKTLKLCSCGK
ncbi:hypothetical protein BS78_07G097700 [Paspalum vaginatum]|nr:hypothetical protein BS78_07G097700 [Paspalum vaginatum]